MVWFKTTIIIMVIMIVCGLAVMVAWPRPLQHPTTTVVLNGQRLKVEVANTPAEQFQGLSDRPSICARCGMLFVFSQSAEHVFVMRRMHFPLDIIWLHNKKVTGMSLNLPPESSEPYTPYPSSGAVDMVLEIPAGTAKIYDIKVGDSLSLDTTGL